MRDERALLKALQAGDPQALAALFDAHADHVYRLALGMLSDPSSAEDVVQDTFLKAITRIDAFEGRSSLGTWLYRIAYNACLDRLRKQGDLTLSDGDYEEDSDAPLPKAFLDWGLTPEQMLHDAEVRAELDAAIAALPETLRATFILRDIEELSTLETAHALDISEGAVKVRLHRARLALREHLASYFTERQTRAD